LATRLEQILQDDADAQNRYIHRDRSGPPKDVVKRLIAFRNFSTSFCALARDKGMRLGFLCDTSLAIHADLEELKLQVEDAERLSYRIEMNLPDYPRSFPGDTRD
jgi:hypothetical protein